MVALAVVASSCTKELSKIALGPTVEMELVAGVEATKTSLLDGRDVLWLMSDELSFFDGTENRKLTAKSVSGTSAVFTGQVAQGCTDFLAVYPYNSSASANIVASTVTTVIPASQEAVENSFGDGCNIALSKGTADPVSGMKTYSTFFNACQLIRFTIPSYLNNVTEVTIASNRAIAGTVTFDFSGDEPVLSSVSGASKVTLTGNFQTGSSYYAVVAPVDFGGITVTMTSNGKVYTKSSAVQITGTRNKPFNIGEINFPAQATCTISHYNDASGNLAGSNAVVSLVGVADNVTAWSADLYKGNIKVRSIYVEGNLSSGETMKVEGNWPYLPKGTYTLKNVKYVRNGKNVRCEDVAVSAQAPNFNCNFSLKGYTNYDVYASTSQNAYGKSGANAANELDGSTVYGIGMSFTGISSDLMDNDNYSKSLTCSYDGVQVASATKGTSLSATKNQSGQPWKAHKVGGTVTFDGVAKSSEITLNVTGLPYSIKTETYNPSGWTVNNTGASDNLMSIAAGSSKGDYEGSAISPEFGIPNIVNISVQMKCYVYGSTSTANLYISTKAVKPDKMIMSISGEQSTPSNPDQINWQKTDVPLTLTNFDNKVCIYVDASIVGIVIGPPARGLYNQTIDIKYR